MEKIEYGRKYDPTLLKEIDASNQTREEVMENCIHNLIVCIGGDPSRPGLVKTPHRVRKMYDEIFEGMNYTNEQLAEKYNVCFDDVEPGNLVVESDIAIHSMCEHHISLMYDMTVAIGYIPKDRVIGLSKLARIAEMVGKRLQLQERIGSEIADVLEMILDTSDIIVVVQGKHGCMTSRGIKSREALTKTATLRGRFEFDSDLRAEFYSLIKK